MYAIRCKRNTGEVTILSSRFRTENSANAACSKLRCLDVMKGQKNVFEYEIIKIGNSAETTNKKNNTKIMTQDEFTAMQKKEHEAFLATLAAVDAQRKALVLNYKAARERRVKAYEAQIVHNPKRHLNHDCYRLHYHFRRELEAVLSDSRTHGLNLENSSVQFAEQAESVVFTITVPKK